MEILVRILPPALAALFGFVLKLDIFPRVKNGHPWKLIGLFFPSLWLTGVGPEGLLKNGGLVMQVLGITPSREAVSLVGFGWLIVAILAAWVIEKGWTGSSIWSRVLYGLAYCGLMSALGVFLLLALAPESKFPSPSRQLEEKTNPPNHVPR